MPEREVRLVNPLGMHARAAGKLVRLAGQFESTVTITRISRNRMADARSILSILELGAKEGSALRISAVGSDADDALFAVCELIDAGFGEI